MNTVRRLLVIDDDPDIGELIQATATGMGLECTAAVEVSEFLSALTPDTDLILLDLMMPETDGIEVLRKLAERKCQASVILMSGIEKRVIETAEKTAQALGLTVAGHLRKPFRLDTLENMLKGHGPPSRSVPRKPADDAPLTERELRRALERDEFVLHYQPQISVAHGSVIGFEALSRWVHPERGLLFPDGFISQLEKLQLIEEFSWNVIQRSLREAGSLRSPGAEVPTISVNLTAQSLHDLALPDRIFSAAVQHNFPAEKIILEITESGLIQKLSRTMDVMTRLRLKQIQLSIDDFGTGYSMMQQLQLVPATELKIDRQFVKDMDTNESRRVLVQKTIELGHELHLRVVAEGVETREQMALLRAWGCDVAQGYLYSGPLPPIALADWLATYRPSQDRDKPGKRAC